MVIIRLLELEEDGDKVLTKNELPCPRLATWSVTGRSEASEVTFCIRWKTPALWDPDKSKIFSFVTRSYKHTNWRGCSYLVVKASLKFWTTIASLLADLNDFSGHIRWYTGKINSSCVMWNMIMCIVRVSERIRAVIRPRGKLVHTNRELTLIVLMWRIGWAHNNARK